MGPVTPEPLHDVPPLLYLPCREGSGPDAQPEVLRRTTKDGRVALVGYTALDRLHAACGTGHPWTLLAVQQLEELHHHEPYDVLYLDLAMPEALRVEGPQRTGGELPPVLYVPCVRHVARLEDAVLEYLRGEDGLVGLPAYTSLDRLHAGRGAERPWLVVESSRLEGLHARAPFDRILLDESLTVTSVEGGWS